MNMNALAHVSVSVLSQRIPQSQRGPAHAANKENVKAHARQLPKYMLEAIPMSFRSNARMAQWAPAIRFKKQILKKQKLVDPVLLATCARTSEIFSDDLQSTSR